MNFNIIRKIIFSTVLVISNFYLTQNKAEAALKKFEGNFPQEKIHIILNKKKYLAGESIWFKSFVFDGYSPSLISTNLYLELYDREKKIIEKKIIPLIRGEGDSSFTLPEDIKEDIYYIHAYTKWMTNFSEDYHWLEPILIYNPTSTEKIVLKDNNDWHFAVFPESETFVEGINTKFAVRIYSKNENISTFTGFVTSDKNPNEKIVNFKSFDENVASFSIIPEADSKYFVTLEDQNGKRNKIPLPEVVKSGINLQVESNIDGINYKLKAKNLSSNFQYKILGTINSQLVYKAEFKKYSDKSFTIPTKDLVNGVMQLTVFDKDENVIAKRLCFVQPNKLDIKKINIENKLIKNSSDQYNSFSLAENKDIEKYTVIIQDANESNIREKSIMSTLWLTGDITSPISKPIQYFSGRDNYLALDALLISENWNRFDWKKIISGVYPIVKNLPDNYITYKAKVTINGKPAVERSLNLIFDIGEAGTKFYEMKTDKNGVFTISGMIFEDTINVSYQLNNSEDKEEVNVYFQPENMFTPLIKVLPESDHKLVNRLPTESLSPELKKMIGEKESQKLFKEKVAEIEEVKIKGIKKVLTKKLEEKLVSPLFKSFDEQIFDFINDNEIARNAPNILNWLQNRVPGLDVISNGSSRIATLRGNKISVYLNEMPVSFDQIDFLPVSSIAMVKVLRGFFPGSIGNLNGGIAIYTRRGEMSDKSISNLPSKLKKYVFKGYPKEISFTNVINNQKFQGIIIDNISTLYWNPQYTNYSENDNYIRFYNNDSMSKANILIIAFDKENNIWYCNENF